MCITRLKSEISGKSRRKNSLGLLALRMQAGILAGVLTFRISSRCSSSSLSQQTEGKRHAEQEASAVASGRRLWEADKAVPGLTGRSIAVPPRFHSPISVNGIARRCRLSPQNTHDTGNTRRQSTEHTNNTGNKRHTHRTRKRTWLRLQSTKHTNHAERRH